MGLPELNRARIEKILKQINTLSDDVKNIDTTVTDEKFPNRVPPKPTNVRASALFRSIQLSWDFMPYSYIACYEVFASKNPGFIPRDEHKVYRGADGGYIHPASLGETWYFRVRAVNHHGVASEFSDEVSATTVSIDGLEIDEKYKIDLLEEANLYTDERRDEIMTEVGKKVDADYVHGALLLKADAQTVQDGFNDVYNRLQEKASVSDLLQLGDSLTGLEGRVEANESNIVQLDNEIQLRVTHDVVDALEQRVENAESSITLLEDGIQLLATKSEVDAIDQRVSVNESSITALNDAIQLRVTKTEFNSLENRVDATESSITMLGDQINLRVTKDDFDELEERVSTNESNIDLLDDKIELRVTKEEYDLDINNEQNGLIARMNRAESDITALSGEISLRVTETELDTRMQDVVHRLDYQEGLIQVNSDAIAQRVTKTEYNSLAQRVTDAEGSITTLAGEVLLKASQSDLNAIDQRLSSAEATLTILPDQINSKVEKNGIISSINQTPESIKISAAKVAIDGDLVVEDGLVRLKDAIIDRAHIKNGVLTKDLFAENAIIDSINAGTALIDFAKIGNVEITNAHIIGQLDASKIRIGASTTFETGYDPKTKADASNVYTKTEVDEAIDAIEVGGRNLFTLSDWKGTISINTLENFRGKFWAQRIYLQDWTSKKLLPNETYTIRFKAKLISKPSTPQNNTWISIGFRLYEADKGSMVIGEVTKAQYDNMEVGDEIEVVNTFTTPSNVHELAVLLYCPRHDPAEIAEVEFSEVKLEKGNKATDWSQAPEDVQEQIDAKPDTTYVDERIDTVIADYQTMIEAKSDEILMQVSETMTTTEGVLREYTDSKIAQTAEDFDISFTNIQNTLGEYGEGLNIVHSYFNFSDEGLNIGKSDSPLNIIISNEQMSFKDSDTTVAYINGQKMFITDIEVLNSLVVGVHKIERYNNGVTLIKWVGE